MSLKSDFLKTLKKEISLRKNYLKEDDIDTVYFGGGTPSVLSPEETGNILDVLNGTFHFVNIPEITFECNPEDINRKYLNGLKKIGINRLSIGCQSFSNRDLTLMNRRHDAKKSYEAVREAHEVGFDNLSVDLIYGIPGMTLEEWKNNLDIALNLPVKHLSAYLLTVEENTVFAVWKQKGKITLPDENSIISQYQMLVKETKDKDFIHYEISNYGKENYFSKHNRMYWDQGKYLGLGPSAHSFNSVSRQWNTRDLIKYISETEKGKVPYEKEILSEKMRFNDYVLTSMRTMWGTELARLKRYFPDTFVEYFLSTVRKWGKTGHIIEKEGRFMLTNKGILLSDAILAECMLV